MICPPVEKRLRQDDNTFVLRNVPREHRLRDKTEERDRYDWRKGCINKKEGRDFFCGDGDVLIDGYE